MNIIKVQDSEEMSREAAKRIIEKIKAKPSLTLGLATGSTPIGTYKKLIEDHIENGTSYRKVNTVNLDEYVGLPEEDPNSYHYFMMENLINHIDIPFEQSHIQSGLVDDLEQECQRYESLIKSLGGIDLQLLGIGANGHIGFNEPGTSFQSTTHVVKLTEETRKANARFFQSVEEVPTYAITMGIKTILDSSEIIMLACGKGKAEAMKQLITGEANESVPASAIKLHSNVTIIADQAALSLV